MSPLHMGGNKYSQYFAKHSLKKYDLKKFVPFFLENRRVSSRSLIIIKEN